MAKCTECGGAVTDESKFCNFCGAKLNVVSEHLGTRILGNTEAIMGALERIAPGAAQQYTVLGTANDGPLASGLIMWRTDEKQSGFGGSFWWSDGDRSTEVATNFVDECFERGGLAFDPGLVYICKQCLSRHHRTRRVLGLYLDVLRDQVHFPLGMSEESRLGSPVSLFALREPRDACPSCAARVAQDPEFLAHRAAEFEAEITRERVYWSAEQHARRTADAKRYLKVHRRDAPDFRKPYEDAFEMCKQEAAVLSRVAGVLAHLAGESRRYVDCDTDVFRDFAERLPDVLLEPAQSAAAWWEYQRQFARVTGHVVLDGQGLFKVLVPRGASEDPVIHGLVNRISLPS